MSVKAGPSTRKVSAKSDKPQAIELQADKATVRAKGKEKARYVDEVSSYARAQAI
jgi:hypothetical protein